MAMAVRNLLEEPKDVKEPRLVNSQIHNQERLGIGLGLYLGRMMIEEHPGRKWVESKPGEDSTFHFTLPLRPGAIYQARRQ
jgi:signal transduction histidine kinase